MFMSVRTGMKVSDLFPSENLRKWKIFTRGNLGLDDFIPFPDGLDAEKTTVEQIIIVGGGLLIKFECSDKTVLWAKLNGPRVAITAARVGQW